MTPEVHPGPNGGIHETLGDHGARIKRIEKDLHEMKGDVRAIRDVVVQTKGGWKVVTFVIACAGAVGAVVGWAVSLLK